MRTSDGLPRITIEKTAANDLYLMLNLLAPTTNVAKVVSDPRGFLHDHRAEFRFLRQIARGYRDLISRNTPATVEDAKQPEGVSPVQMAFGDRTPGPPHAPSVSDEEAVAQLVRGRTSILR